MRKLAALVFLAALVVGYLVADTVVRDHVERDIAARIEQDVPGSAATVTISSFPFTGRLAVQGSVQSLTATVTGVSVGGVAVSSIDIDVHGIHVERSALLQGTVTLRSIRSATITATITQPALDSGTGLPLTLGAGTVGIGGLQVPATVAVSGGRIDIGVAGIRTIALPLPPAALLPCPLAGAVSAAGVVLACTTSTIPPALVQAVAAAG